MTVWKSNPARVDLLALYKETDELLAPFSCEASTDCCHFGRTGREPYPTAVELAEVEDAAKGLGLAAKPTRKLPMVDTERRCPLLGPNDRCRIYASRPFGCRTFFCERVSGPGKLPRAEILALGRRIADLSQRAFPRDPHPRPLGRALGRERK